MWGVVIGDIEWDPAKNASNRRKHGISFEEAMEIFDGPVLSREDDDIHGERRERSYGLMQGVVVVVCVVHTDRSTARRIISARKATRKEREEFHACLTKAIG